MEVQKKLLFSEGEFTAFIRALCVRRFGGGAAECLLTETM